MDKITENLLKSYVEASELQNLNEAQQFERFATYIVLSKLYGDVSSANDFCIGDGIQGIDSFAVIIDGVLVSDLSHLEDILSGRNTFQVEFMFLQSKISDKFKLNDLSVFADTVISLLVDQDDNICPEFINMYNLLLEKSDCFIENPIVRLYYVTLGKWVSPTAIEKKIERTKSTLLKSNLVSRVEFHAWGANNVQSNWRTVSQGLKTSFLFENKTILPDIPQIDQSFLGILPASEFIKIITDEDGEIRRVLFYDNVRDFQGDVDVNTDIRKTLKSENKLKFCVLNNGITVVARSIKSTGNNFVIEDYQIVNGCQTSYILHSEQNNITNVHIPFRLIGTKDEEVAKMITIATNKQNQVNKDNLLALREEQKEIEKYFDTYRNDEKHRIYYERRSKQWNRSKEIHGTWRVISLRNLLQTFVSIYFKMPQSTRHYSDLIKREENNVFTSSNHPAYFYSAAYAYCKLEHFFRNSQIDRKLKPFLYHLRAGIRTAFTGSMERDRIESKEDKALNSLKKFNEFLWNDEKYLKMLQNISEIILKINKNGAISEFGRNAEQTKEMLTHILIKYNKKIKLHKRVC